jgi:hypothetical protein
MTIRSNGGIFGRNPTFNDVTVDGDLVVDGGVTVPADSISGDAIDGGTPTPAALVIQSATSPIQLNDAAGVRRWIIQKDTNNLYYYRYNTGGGYAGNPLQISSVNGNVLLEGSLVMKTAGTGIDFSATAGTGTSELFDDYEEGTFTPAYTTTGTDFGAITYEFQSGEYIKIGRLVWCSFQFRTDAVTVGSASGNLRISGLPFTVAGSSAADTFGPVGTYKSFASGNPQVVSPVNGTTQMQVLSHDFVIQPYSILATGADANWLNGDIIYISSV